MLVSPPHVLIVIEDGCTYRTLGPILANNIVVHPMLEIAGIELRYAEVGFTKHGTPPGLNVRVVAPCESGIEICSSSSGSEWSREGKLPSTNMARYSGRTTGGVAGAESGDRYKRAGSCVHHPKSSIHIVR